MEAHNPDPSRATRALRSDELEQIACRAYRQADRASRSKKSRVSPREIETLTEFGRVALRLRSIIEDRRRHGR